MIQLTDGEVILCDQAGKQRAVIQEQPDGPLLLFFHADGRPAAGVAFSPVDGELVITLAKADGIFSAGVRIDDGQPIIYSFDSDGRPLAARRIEDPPPKSPQLCASPN